MASRPLAMPSDPATESACRELARKLGIPSPPLDPALAAQAIVHAAEAGRHLLVLPLVQPSAWDREVVRALARELSIEGRSALAIVLDGREDLPIEAGARLVRLEGRLGPKEIALVWEGFAFEGQARGELSELSALESFWAAAREAKATSAPQISEPARRLLDRLALGLCAWPLSRMAALGGRAEMNELLAHGLATLENACVALTFEGRAHAKEDRADAGDLTEVARALSAADERDPWLLSRAAELHARAGDADAAEAAMARSCSLSDEPAVRADITRKWRAAIEMFSSERRLHCQLRAAEAALQRGDADGALSWARAATDLAPSRYDALVLLGRSALAKGDLVTAGVAFERAAKLSTSATERAQVALDLAEARYAAGDLQGAERSAEDATSGAEDATVRLGARNVLGKLLLAKGRYAEAEAHFAADELDASTSSDATAGLRARLNRAIAVLSSGRNDEARLMLEGVLAEGEARGEQRAVAFALSNLAVLATLRHEYAEALRSSERSIEVRRKLGDKIGLARSIINLAELRLRLGLVSEAEQALAFARRAMGPGMPASRVTEAALVAGHVHLARGRTLEAARELDRALSHVSATTDGEKVSECHRLGARIALEDGDVSKARIEVSRAKERASSTRGRAESVLLEAMALRAGGEEASELAHQALVLSRKACDENLLREAHWLLSELARARGDETEARSHLELSLKLRDQVADRLPPELRQSYLARRDLLSLAAAEKSELEACPAEMETTARVEREPGPERALVGDDPAMKALVQAIGKVARSDSTILIQGESGTGKELVAEAIHAASERAAGPLVKVNCAALVETLLLSELFGHERGAFTGAVGRRRGRFELADGGTLFLDEIGDISPRTQVALLRVLEQRTFERVGGTTTIRADVRIVCATHRDLRAMVERGEFREDLYYRLRGITLEVPSLRERMGDLPKLAETLLARIAAERGETKKTLGRDALALLGRHRWPGNVRELENALRAASLFAEGGTIEVHDLADNVDGLRAIEAEEAVQAEDVPSAASPLAASTSDATEVAYAQVRMGGVSLGDLKRRIERDCIARALEETGGNITRAAALLGMKRPRLSQLVKQYNLGIVSEGE